MVQVIREPDKFQGLAAALQGLIQGQDRRFQKQQQANQISSVNQFFQAGGTGQSPRLTNPMAQQLFASRQGQQQQFERQQELQKQNQQASMAQAIAIQNAKSRNPTPSAQLAQKKLDAINLLESKAKDGTISPAEKSLLEKSSFGSGGVSVNLNNNQKLAAASQLRGEFNSDQRVKDFRVLAPKFKNMLSFISRSEKAGQKGPTDIALSKTFQKLTDLMSSVREGEYETTFRGQPLMDKLKGGIKKLVEGGEGITPEFRRELVDTARLMFEDGKLFFNEALQEKWDIADASEISRGMITGKMELFDVTNTDKEFNDLFGTEQPQQQDQSLVQQPINGPSGGDSQSAAPMSAVNPQTGERIQSTDGGQTWQPVQ